MKSIAYIFKPYNLCKHFFKPFRLAALKSQGRKRLTELIDKPINDNALSRAAPARLGLLNIFHMQAYRQRFKDLTRKHKMKSLK